MFCECGCGRKTNIIKAHHKGQGRVKGEHSRFLKGHHLRKNIDKWVARQGKHICQCGCGDYIVVKSNHYKKERYMSEIKEYVNLVKLLLL